jgi:hypothetical protein
MVDDCDGLGLLVFGIPIILYSEQCAGAFSLYLLF